MSKGGKGNGIGSGINRFLNANTGPASAPEDWVQQVEDEEMAVDDETRKRHRSAALLTPLGVMKKKSKTGGRTGEDDESSDDGSDSDAEERKTKGKELHFSDHTSDEEEEEELGRLEHMQATLRMAQDAKKKIEETGEAQSMKEFQLLLCQQLETSARQTIGLETENRRLQRRLKQMDKRVEELEREMERMKKQLHKPEILTAKKGVLIRGVKEERMNEEEDKQKILDDMKEKLGVNPDTIESIKRVQISKSLMEKLEREKKVPMRPILIRFKEVEAKHVFFRSLPKLAEWKEGSGWRVQNDVPMCLKDDFTVLEACARKLRSINKQTRTRIIYRFLELQLQAKNKGDRKWVDLSMKEVKDNLGDDPIME